MGRSGELSGETVSITFRKTTVTKPLKVKYARRSDNGCYEHGFTDRGRHDGAGGVGSAPPAMRMTFETGIGQQPPGPRVGGAGLAGMRQDRCQLGKRIAVHIIGQRRQRPASRAPRFWLMIHSRALTLQTLQFSPS